MDETRTRQLLKSKEDKVESEVYKIGNETSTGYFAVRKSEFSGLANFLNQALKNDPLVNSINPILPVKDTSSEEFCASFGDGRLLISLINYAKPGLINTENLLKELRRKGGKTSLNRRRQSVVVLESLNNAISVCQKIPGVVVINVGAFDFVGGKTKIILGLVWQIVGVSFMNKVALRFHPEIIRLLNKDENLDDFYSMPPDDALLRWVNWHIAEDAAEKNIEPVLISNFNTHVKDCRAYNILIQRCDPTLEPANEEDIHERAKHVIDNIIKLGVPDVLTSPRDIEKGQTRMNAALFAQMFNYHTGLDKLSNQDLRFLIDVAKSNGMHKIAEDLIKYKAAHSMISRIKGHIRNNKGTRSDLSNGLFHLQQQFKDLINEQKRKVHLNENVESIEKGEKGFKSLVQKVKEVEVNDSSDDEAASKGKKMLEQSSMRELEPISPTPSDSELISSPREVHAALSDSSTQNQYTEATGSVSSTFDVNQHGRSIVVDDTEISSGFSCFFCPLPFCSPKAKVGAGKKL